MDGAIFMFLKRIIFIKLYNYPFKENINLFNYLFIN